MIIKQYIDKAALVEWLNKMIRSITRLLDLSKEREMDIHLLSKVHTYEDMLDFINALEVKEMDDEHPQTPQLSAADRGIIEEIIFALNSLGKEKMISYHKEIEFLNKIRKL